MKIRFSLIIFLAVSFCVAEDIHAQQTYKASLSSAQQVVPNSSTAIGVGAVSINAAQTQITVILTFSGLSSEQQAAHIYGPATTGVEGPVLFTLPNVGGVSGTITASFSVTPQHVDMLRAGLWYLNIHSASFPGGEIRGQLTISDRRSDFDGDGKQDLTVFRPSEGNWYVLSSLNNSFRAQPWGIGSDQFGLVPADYDGDGKTDFGVVRAEGSNAIWYILQSATNTIYVRHWGAIGTDYAGQGDYDGDGKTDIAVIRVNINPDGPLIWYILRSSDGALQTGQIGTSNDLPASGDYDRDGKTDVAVLHIDIFGGQNLFLYRPSSNPIVQILPVGPATIPIQADYDGDGATDPAVWKDGLWTIYQSSDSTVRYEYWGLTSDRVKTGDFNGDGKADFAVWRPSDGFWYILNSANGTIRAEKWGTNGDSPI